MTRKEAIYKVKTSSFTQYPEAFVDALEALGLLKFKEEKNDKYYCFKDDKGDLVYIELNEIIEQMKNAGYKVTNG